METLSTYARKGLFFSLERPASLGSVLIGLSNIQKSIGMWRNVVRSRLIFKSFLLGLEIGLC